jgi:hypothetical protein
MTNLSQIFNFGIVQIWKEYSCPLPQLSGTDRFPMVLPNIGQSVRVVYSGINPSFNLPRVECFANAVGCPLQHFEWRSDMEASEVNGRVALLQTFEAEARIKYTSYFGPFKRFSNDIGISHEHTTHLDVLGIRATSQKQLIDKLHALRAQQQIRGFIDAQRLLYAEILRRLSPEIVLVANASAARWIREDLNLTASADKRFYRWQAVPNATFILSGQLGGGVTDEFSRDRLVADVRSLITPIGRSGNPACGTFGSTT